MPVPRWCGFIEVDDNENFWKISIQLSDDSVDLSSKEAVAVTVSAARDKIRALRTVPARKLVNRNGR